MCLDGQSRVDRQDLEEEGQLTVERVFDFGAEAGGVVGNPLAQCCLGDAVVFDLGVAFWVSAHPQLEETADINTVQYTDSWRLHRMNQNPDVETEPEEPATGVSLRPPVHTQLLPGYVRSDVLAVYRHTVCSD